MSDIDEMAEKLFFAEEIFTELEAENSQVKELYSRIEQLEKAIKAICGDKIEEYADIQTKLQYEISKYSFMCGVKVGMALNEL